jgi:hypothetical protein
VEFQTFHTKLITDVLPPHSVPTCQLSIHYTIEFNQNDGPLHYTSQVDILKVGTTVHRVHTDIQHNLVIARQFIVVFVMT